MVLAEVWRVDRNGGQWRLGSHRQVSREVEGDQPHCPMGNGLRGGNETVNREMVK